MIVIVVVALSQASRLAPSLFVGQCTNLGGMCTPARCTCPAPLRKRELVTQDAQACFQCVAEFCPAVSKGDSTCTTAACECDDPSWPKVDVQENGQSCWQCVRPSVDFTARIGPSDDTCLALAPSAGSQEDAAAAAPTSVAMAAAGSTRRLVHVRNRSECIPLRYNGARITEKRSNHSCLAWSHFGEHWGLAECDMGDPLMYFKQLSIPEAAAASSHEVYCSGESGSEFCVEVAEVLCTEEEGRCSTEACRCEDPSWIRQELQTLNGSQCFTCSPPPMYCETSQDSCTYGQCECADPMHVKVLAAPGDLNPEDGFSQKPCFQCQAPEGRNSEASMLATFLLLVIAGVAGGCVLRRLRDPVTAPTATGKKLKRQLAAQAADGPRSWSERWAEELEDSIEALYEAFVENPSMLVRWLRPHLRQVGRVAGNVLDACDVAMEPVYCAIDFVQAWVWDTIVIQHERLVAVVNWICDRYSDLSQLVSRGFHRGSTSSPPAKSKGSKRSKAREEPHDSVDNSPSAEADVSAHAVKAKVRAPKRPEVEAQKPQPEGSRPRPDGGEIRGGLVDLFAHGGAAASPPTGQPEDFDWDPLGLTDGAGPSTPQSNVAVPEEFMRRLVGMQQQQRAQAQSPQPPSSTARPSSVQLRAQRKLQQRREALAQQQRGTTAASPQPAQEAEPAVPIDESWIDELEREESKTKSTGKKASKASRKKQATAGKDAASAGPGGASAEAAEEAAEAAEEDRGQEGYQYHEETVVKTPPMAEPVEPARQQDPALLEEAVAAAAAKGGAEKEVEQEDEATSGTACGPAEAESELFDPERVLGEAMHGLFLLASGHGNAPVIQEQTDEAQNKETEDEAAGGEAAEEEEAEEEEEEAGEEEAKKDVEEEAEEDEAEEDIADVEAEEEEDEAKEEVVEEAALVEPAEPPAVEPQRSEGPVEEPALEEPVLSAKQRKRRAKAAAAAAAAATPISPLPGRALAPAPARAQPEVAPAGGRAAAPEEPLAQLPRRCETESQVTTPGIQPQGAAAVRPGGSPPPATSQRLTSTSATQSPRVAAAKARPVPGPARGMPAPGRVGVKLPSAVEPRAAAPAERTSPASGGGSSGARKPGDGGPPRAWASIVAGWAKSEEEPAQGEAAAPRPGSTLGGVEAPEFVPFAMMQEAADDAMLRPFRQRQRKGNKHPGLRQQQQPACTEGSFGQGQGEYEDSFADMVTTIMATGIEPKLSQADFAMQLDSWGLIGTYDFLYMPVDPQTQMGTGCAFINFIDPAFVLLFCWIFHEFQFEGTVAPAEVQGLEANHLQWQQCCGGQEGSVHQPMIMPNPAPSQWSVNTVNAMLSPQFREQFRKTKMCVFHRKNRCEMGAGCPFAHSQSELMPAPDLAKTKLCFNYFRGRCNDPRCKFAHGSQELRSVWVPYSPGVWFCGPGEDVSGGQCYVQPDGALQEAGTAVGFTVMEQHLSNYLQGGEETSSTDARSDSTAIFSNGGTGLCMARPDLLPLDKIIPATTARGDKLSSVDVGDGIALRVRGTFMEAMRCKEPLDPEESLPMKRSLSDSDLAAFRAAMDEAGV